jgi:D-alanine-D-alanine ligase
MTKIHVVCGGDSDERAVSLRSGTAVAAALVTAGYNVTTLDLSKAGLNEITSCDVVFPVLHGTGGEDGTLQAQLENVGSKYIGSGPEASRLCYDKWEYRRAVTIAGLPTADGTLVRADNYRQHPLTSVPYVLKCQTGGSSIDTFIVRDPTQAPHDKILETFTRHPTMLLERLIVGTELTVAVLGDKALPVIEIIPPASGEFDYENKYNGATRELVPPENVSEASQSRARALALQAHLLTKCRDFSRTDIMLDADGNPFLLETNTIPGMTDQSLFPKAAQAAGIEMPALCAQLVEMALKR